MHVLTVDAKISTSQMFLFHLVYIGSSQGPVRRSISIAKLCRNQFPSKGLRLSLSGALPAIIIDSFCSFCHPPPLSHLSSPLISTDTTPNPTSNMETKLHTPWNDKFTPQACWQSGSHTATLAAARRRSCSICSGGGCGTRSE